MLTESRLCRGSLCANAHDLLRHGDELKYWHTSMIRSQEWEDFGKSLHL